MLVVHPAFFSGKASLLPGFIVEREVGCIGKADHALTSGNASDPYVRLPMDCTGAC